MHSLQSTQRIVVVLLIPSGPTGDLIVRRNVGLLLAEVSIVIGCVTTGAGALQAVVVEELAAIPGAIATGRAGENLGELQT